MVIFGFAIFVLLIHFLYDNIKSERAKTFLWIFVCVAVVLFIGFRSKYTGADTRGYVRGFIASQNTSWRSVVNTTYKDPGYIYFVKIISTITSSEVLYLVITSFLSFIGVFDVIKRNTEKPVLALFFFITLGNFLFATTGIRQAIAMSMCMLSVRFIQERKLIPFVIFVWLGAQLHHSAYLFLVTYILAVRKVSPTSMLTNIIITVVAYFSYETLLNVANDVLNYNYGIEELDNGFIFYIIILLILVFGFVMRDRWVTDNKNQTVIMNLGIMCGIIWTFRLIGRTAERPSMYFLGVIPIVLVNAVESLEKEDTKRIIMIIAIILTLIFFFKRTVNYHYGWFWEVL